MAEDDQDFVFVDAAEIQHGSEGANLPPQPAEVRAKIRKWLAPSEFSSESSDFNKHLRSYVPKTGEWLRRSEKFTQWHNEGSTALWVNGTPGTGKSVVAATLIRDFVKVEAAPVLFFFFRHANLANRAPEQLTRDWMSQLLDYSPLLQSLLKDLAEKQPKHEDVPFDQLWSCVCSATSTMAKVYCVADALDEMGKGNDWFLPKLISLGQQNPMTLKVVVTSRQSPHIEAVFKEGLIIDINLNRRLIDHDIATYVEHLLRNPPKLGITIEDRELITSTIQEKASGLFLYARLMMEEVLQNLHHQSVEGLLLGLPTGVEGMYTTLLREHSLRSGVSHELQKLILQWVTHSSRPLRLLEVAEIIRFTEEGKDLGSVQEIKANIRTACGPLLTILPDETLQVIHHSFTEFLVAETRSSSAVGVASYAVFDSLNVHGNATMTCLRYLSYCSVMLDRSEQDQPKDAYTRNIGTKTRDNLFVEHPFLQYATAYWMVHACKVGECSLQFLDTLREFFDLEKDVYSYWQGIWRASEQRAVKDAVLQPLHAMAQFGLSSILSVLFQQGCSWKVDVRDSAGREPLSYAAEQGDLSSTNLLLAYGASVNAQSSHGIVPIHYACSANQPAMVKCLLGAGADPLHRTPEPMERPRTEEENLISHRRHRFGVSPLNHACASGYSECLYELLRYINPQILRHGPLHWAAKNGQAEIVRLLLQTGYVDPNVKDHEGNTPLGLAAHQRSPLAVAVLLEAGADVTACSCGIDRKYGLTDWARADGDVNALTALHAWACGGDWGSTIQEMVDTAVVLIKAGCDVNARDTEGKTPLFRWSRLYDLGWASAFLKVLLDNGADPSASDHLGNTPLHAVTDRHTDAQIRALVNAGGDMNAHRLLDGQTPLMCTFEYLTLEGRADWHEFVEKYGVDPNAQSLDGRTTLHRALASDAWSVSKVKHWLQAGADPKIEDNQGQNCLFALRFLKNAKKSEGELVHLLQTAAISLHARDHKGRNVPLNAIISRDADELKRWKSYGFELLARDYQGKTALHVLASKELGHHETSDRQYKKRIKYMELFIGEGLDPNVRDHSGNTMLHDAIMNTGPFFKSTRLLLHTALDVGVDPSLCNHQGRSILHLAAALPIEHYGYGGCDGEKRLEHLIAPPFSLDVNRADHDGITPLHLAATNAASRVSTLLCAGSDVTAADHKKRTALHYAARGGNPNGLGCLLSFLKQGALTGIISKADCNGRTALHDAVRSGVLESVEVLLAASADPNMQDFNGKTSLHIASECREERIVVALQRSSQQQFANNSSEYPLDKWKRQYSNHPAGLNVVDSSRPRYQTSKEKKRDRTLSNLDLEDVSPISDIVRLLLDAGCGPGITDDEGKTPYDAAIASDCKEVAAALAFTQRPASNSLVTGKAELRLCNTAMAAIRERSWDLEPRVTEQAAQEVIASAEEATTLLLPAIHDGNATLVRKLLELGAEPLKPLPDGKIILHGVARNGLVSTMMLLVRCQDVQSLPRDLILRATQRERPNIEMIKFLVQLGLDVNATKEIRESKRKVYCKHVGSTPLHFLAVADQWWKPLALDYLLSHGGDPELCTSSGQTALQIAIRGRLEDYEQPGFFRREAIAVLLKHNARVNYVNSQGRTPLIESFDEGVDIVRTLLLHGADVSFGDEPPIGYAVASFNVAVVQAMVEAGADCNAMCHSRERRPKMPLLSHTACGHFGYNPRSDSRDYEMARAEDIMQLLLENGADPNKPLEDGTPLITAVIRYWGILKPFLSLGIDLEVRDQSGKTPLLTACTRQNYGAITLLVDSGVNTLAVDDARNNALHLIAQVSWKFGSESASEIANKLVVSGHPLNNLNAAGFSPLHYAVKRNSHVLIATLLKAGADAAAPYPSEGGKTVLHLLLPCMAQDGSSRHQSEYIPLAQRFIDAGVDKEARDSEGNTAIFGYVAMQPSYKDYGGINLYPDLKQQREVLSDYDLHSKNEEGQTLMHVVAKRSKEIEGLPEGRDDTRDMFKLLWELGCDPKAEDGQQRTPLDVAAACGNRGILDLFAPVEVG